ncbi:MAG TPA: amidase family protein, partial [Pirellulaceae bacterium]
LILGPVAPTTAFELGTRAADPLAMYLGDLYTVGTNLAGLPAIAIPCGFDRVGLPIGLQLQAPAFGETRLLQAGAMFQRATNWHQRAPELT